MKAELHQIPVREVLHYLGWRGTPLDSQISAQIEELTAQALDCVQPRIVMRRFKIEGTGELGGTTFTPAGEDVGRMLAPCKEAVLLAATLGAEAERLLLRMQAKDAVKALILDAVLSAGIEELLDQQEDLLRRELHKAQEYLTDRFSPGYGDMPLAQSREICEVLSAQRKIGLNVAASGIMIPRKSVTAIMGISDQPVPRRPRGCAVCEARAYCALCRPDTTERRNEE